MNHNNVDAASGRLCDADRGDPQSAFDSVRGNFSGGKSFAVNPLGVDRSGNTATVDYTITDPSGTTHTFHLKVVDEGGTWKACP